MMRLLLPLVVSSLAASPIGLTVRASGGDLLVVSLQNQSRGDITSIAAPTADYRLTQAGVVFFHANGAAYPAILLRGAPRSGIIPPGGGATAFLDALDLVDLSRQAGVPQAPGFRVPFQIKTRYGGASQVSNACTLVLGHPSLRPHTPPSRPGVEC